MRPTTHAEDNAHRKSLEARRAAAKAAPKTTGLDLLNKVQRFVIDYANTNGIQLATMGTVQQFKQFIVALTIQTLTDNGHTMEQAFDIVFGDGSFHKLAEDVWETIRRNEAAKATA